MSKEELLRKVFECITNVKIKEAPELGKKLVEAGIPADKVGKVLIEAMTDIGVRYEAREIGLPHLFLGTKCLTQLAAPFKEKLASKEPRGIVVIGTVKGDVHAIGKNLVSTMLEVYGYKTFNLGEDVDADKFIAKAKEVSANIIGMSALLTLTKTYFKEIIKRLEAEGLRDKIKVMVGGAPVTAEYAKIIGADGYAHDAVTAVTVADALMRGKKKFIE